MTSETISRLFSPRSVAVIGASRDPRSVGHQIFHNLLAGGFQGPVYPVNRTARDVASVRAYPSVLDIPDPVDVAIIVVPAPAVLSAVDECGRKGVKGLVIITAGFRETGADGAAREARLADLLDKYGMRAIGPNCMGILNKNPDVRLNATFSPATNVKHGKTAFVSQSGALGMAILDQAADLGLGLSYFASLGNKTNVSTNDLLAVWADDPQVDLILLYLENFGNPRKFIQLARAITPNKPIIAVKSGRTAAGARAAGSHTGALAEGDAIIEALFEQCGVIRAQSIQELFEHARVFSRASAPRGRRVGIVTNSGGPAIMATDALLARDLQLAELTEETMKRLRAALLPEASVANPVDVIAGGGATDIRAAIEAVASDPNVDALIVIYTPPVFVDDVAVSRAILDAKRGDKPLLACVLGKDSGGSAFHLLTEGGLPTYVFPESAVRALAALVRHTEWHQRPTGHVLPISGARPDEASAILQRAQASGAEWLDPDDATRLIECYGVSVARSKRVTTPTEAAEAAASIGGPVVLKAIAPGLVHKSDAGGVDLKVVDAAESYRKMSAGLTERGYAMEGALVQARIPRGHEILVGMAGDPKFGPLLAFGLGGIFVEILKDVSFRLAPLTDEDAKRMVRSIRAWPLLEGARGNAAADVPAIEDALLRVSALVSAHPSIRELEINPLIVGEPGHGAVAADARVRIWPAGIMPRAAAVTRELATH
ncbi:MAG: acetate--CoA ligase family protein [Candidatus Thermoplasmatota archaeon]